MCKSLPVSLTPITLGHLSSQGMSAITSTASAPPTPANNHLQVIALLTEEKLICCVHVLSFQSLQIPSSTYSQLYMLRSLLPAQYKYNYNCTCYDLYRFPAQYNSNWTGYELIILPIIDFKNKLSTYFSDSKNL